MDKIFDNKITLSLSQTSCEMMDKNDRNLRLIQTIKSETNNNIKHKIVDNKSDQFIDEMNKNIDSKSFQTIGKVSEESKILEIQNQLILGLKPKTKKKNLRTKFCSYPNCDYKTKAKDSMESHINSVHLKSKPFFCDKCKKGFTGKHNLIAHKRVVHSINKFKCDWNECHFVTHNQQYLKNHKIRHSGKKPFKCDWTQCNNSYYNVTSLRCHQRRAHQNWRPYVCQWPGCESALKTSEQLKHHLRTHTGEKPYACDWPGCDSCFAQKQSLIKHKDIHNEVRNHVCLWPNCGKKFRRSYHLKVHQMTHQKDRQLCCDFQDCKRRFAQKSSLLRHLKSH